MRLLYVLDERRNSSQTFAPAARQLHAKQPSGGHETDNFITAPRLECRHLRTDCTIRTVSKH